MSAVIRTTCLLLAVLLLPACNRQAAPTPATPLDPSSAVSASTVGDATLQASTVPLAVLNDAMARHYGVDTSAEGVLLLVTLRDAQGNALAPADLQLSATAAVLPAPPQPLALRMIQIDGMTDYIGVLHAKAPASATFKLVAQRDGARSDITTTVDLQPR